MTQQVVKMVVPAQETRTFVQKVREALMANLLDTRTSKDKTLEAYLNLAYFGDGRYGVESAARGYFNKPASKLTLSEAALLAGVIDLPTKAAPTNDVKLATQRRDAVLSKMLDLGMITSGQELDAVKSPVTLSTAASADSGKIAPHFVEYVKQELISKLGANAVYTGGLRVYTTLRPAVQQQAEAAVASVLPAPTDPEAAVVSVIPSTGEIVAMIGGRDFKTAQFNLAAQGRRQPGSAFKPFVLVVAMDKGISPDRQFETAPLTVKVKDGVWNVTNFENEFTTGQLTLRAATDWSVNAVFARLVLEVGPQPVVDAAKRMGITSPLNPDPAIALGGLTTGVSPLEMASAYGTLSNAGVHVEPIAVTKVTDGGGHVLMQPKPASTKAVDPAVAATVSGMLHDVVERGTGMNARFGGWAAGKTGTTQSYRDAWFVGYSGDLCTAVWVGYRQGQVDMTNVRGVKVAGGTFPAMIWARYTGAALPALAPSVTSVRP
jgi:penicillin-binding protein 1A